MLIGITGNKGSGKSTVAQCMVKIGYTELEFSYHLKHAACWLLGVDFSWLQKANSKQKEERVPGYSFTYRQFMQKLGTDFIRNQIDDNLWVDRLAERYKQTSGDVVISDVRFNNEAKFIVDNGGIIIKILREKLTDDHHESEAGIDHKYIKYSVDNYGNLKELAYNINMIFKKLHNNK